MPRIAVVTDSAACIPTALKQQFDIHEVPFELTWDGVIYRDGVDLTPTDFYRRFRQAHTYPTTSQPPFGAFTALYARLSQEYDGVVSIHVSADMTGTVHTARLAAEQAMTHQHGAPSSQPGEKSPDVLMRHRVPIRVLDSRTATIAEGFVVLAAARAAAAGATLDQVVEQAEQVIGKVDFFATLKTLEHIHRGGRIGEAAALLGNQLKITPILNLKNGRVSIVGLTRSWRHALQEVVNMAVERVRGKRDIHASVFHADAPKDAEWLREQFLARVQCVELHVTAFTPVMGAHTGPDVVGLVFYGD
jgi:DegV family protein with EDD domain